MLRALVHISVKTQLFIRRSPFIPSINKKLIKLFLRELHLPRISLFPELLIIFLQPFEHFPLIHQLLFQPFNLALKLVDLKGKLLYYLLFPLQLLLLLLGPFGMVLKLLLVFILELLNVLAQVLDLL